MSYTGSQSSIGLGSLLSISTGGGTPTFVVVGEVTEVALSGREAGVATTTNLQSTEQEFLPTILTPGSMKLSGNRVATDAGQIAVNAAFTGLTLASFKLQLSKSGTQTTSGDTWVFNALVQDSNFTVSVDKIINFDVTLKMSGAPTITAGS